ncbi:MAG: hypothetical protein Q9228_006493, partial [Teloschistes exilis]
MVLYCLLVVGHTIYSGTTGKHQSLPVKTHKILLRRTPSILPHPMYTAANQNLPKSGISSNCWDTIAEVTAIAVNSRPTSALRNTCAGISEFHIFKLPVHILVSRDDEGEGEHLELVFGE